MLSAAGIALAATALAAGLTGAWSPCGFSMVETIGRTDCRRATTLASCLTFTAGSLAGGVVTFGALALLGRILHGAGGAVAAGVAAAIALAAAGGEARGARIVPQIRRQVPEPWRRTMPLPLAASLYGGLLGLGFTTFVLTWGVWALAGISLALGQPALGIAIGLAFGAGRALPVVALAPVAQSAAGVRAAEMMAERPSILRGFRAADAIGLAACAAVLILGAGDRAVAATRIVASDGRDPSAGPGLVAWNSPAGGVLRAADRTFPLPGTHPAIGGGLLAYVQDDVITVVRLHGSQPVTSIRVAGVDALAISARWLVYRTRTAAGEDRLTARPLDEPSSKTLVAAIRAPAQLGRPSVDGDVVVYGREGRHDSRIVERRLGRHSRRRVVRFTRSGLLLNPAVRGRQLVYVRATSLSQELVLGRRSSARHDRVLFRTGPAARRDEGHQPGYSPVTATPNPPRAHSILWTTALTRIRAYLTLLPLPGHHGHARIVTIRR